MAVPPPSHQAIGSALTSRQHLDPLQWMRHYWEQQDGDDPSQFLAMTSVLRLHQLMTTSLEQRLRAAFGISLTDYQILKALELTETGTWLLSRLAWHLMVHATTVTLTVGRLETKHLVTREPHPRDRRATLVTITDAGRETVGEATEALSRIQFGLPGLTRGQARSLTAVIARVRAMAGDVDRSYLAAPTDLG